MWFVLWMLLGCGDSEGGEDDGPPKVVEPVSVVEVDHVRLGSVGDLLTASAVVESQAMANLVPEASGVVTEILADEGDPVVQGQVLAILNNVSLGMGAAKARGEVTRLKDQANRTRALFDQGAVSARDLGEAEHALQTARLSMREASAGYGNTRIVAPFDGVVALRNVKVGELATSAQTAFQVVDLSALRVVASLPERELGRVQRGQLVRLASAYDTEQSATGYVERVSPVVDSSSGTFRVTVSVDPGQQTLRPGQFVSVTVEVGRHSDVTVVPKKSVVYEDGVPVVYRVVDPPEEKEGEEGEEDEEEAVASSWWPFGGDEEPADEADEADEDDENVVRQVAERRVVTLGLVDEVFAEVTKGVDDADIVVTVGQSHLRDGAKVRPQEKEDAEPAEDDGDPG